jgi:hypothetical protein
MAQDFGAIRLLSKMTLMIHLSAIIAARKAVLPAAGVPGNTKTSIAIKSAVRLP